MYRGLAWLAAAVLCSSCFASDDKPRDRFVGGSGFRAVCGDDRAEAAEVCDGRDLDNRTCADLGFGPGTLACQPDCLAYDASACAGGPQGPVQPPGGTGPTGPTGSVPECGNGVWEHEESCDGDSVPADACTDHGFEGGEASCTGACALDLSGCAGNRAYCGDGIRNNEEECDGEDLAEARCQDFGFERGHVTCDPACFIDASQCSGTPGYCGDGIQDENEECDDLGFEATCAGFGYDGGQIYCMACTLLIECFNSEDLCGNGTRDPNEACDGEDNPATCEGLGYDGGDIGCTACEVDDSQCWYDPCGNGRVDVGEACDGTKFGGLDCTDFGRPDGALTCSDDCETITLDACDPVGPPEDLVVELTWAAGGAYPDLYVTRGSGEFCVADKCGWDNCTDPAARPDWDGAPGTDGDPLLTGYDGQGLSTTPVTATIVAPLDDLYGVYVHLPELNNYTQPSVDVTVTIWARGASQPFVRARRLDEAALWDLARVAFNSGTAAIAESNAYITDFTCQAPPAPCNVHTDCASDEYCNVSEGGGECAIGCRDNASCGSGFVCNADRACVAGPVAGWGEDCIANAGCEAGLFCSPLTSTCTEWCFSPGPCNGGGLCCPNTQAAYCSNYFGFPIGFCSNVP